MGQDLIGRDPPPSEEIHPGLYGVIAGFALLFIVSAFAFGDSGYSDYLLAVVSGFFVIVMTVPFLLWLTWRRHAGRSETSTLSLREWFRRDCDTWQCRLKAREAAIQILLPVAAVAVGMSAIGIVMLLVEGRVL